MTWARKFLNSPHLITSNDIFCNFDVTKLTGKGNIKRTHKCADKHTLAKKIFLRYLHHLVTGLATSGKTFVMPYKYYTCIRWVEVPRICLAAARKNSENLLSTVDPLISNFKSYELRICYKLYGKVKPINAPLIVSSEYKQLIINKVNTGYKYVNKDITYYLDYTQLVYNEFTDVDEKAINRVVRHGLMMICKLRRSGMDIHLNHNNEFRYFFFGEPTMAGQERWEMYKRKIRAKTRIMSMIKHHKNDGYYYFGLSEEQYVQSQKGAMPQVIAFKLFEEAKLYKIAKYFYRVKLDGRRWLTKLINYETSNAELLQ